MGVEECAEAGGDEQEERDEAGQILRFKAVEDEMAGLKTMRFKIEGR